MAEQRTFSGILLIQPPDLPASQPVSPAQAGVPAQPAVLPTGLPSTGAAPALAADPPMTPAGARPASGRQAILPGPATGGIGVRWQPLEILPARSAAPPPLGPATPAETGYWVSISGTELVPPPVPPVRSQGSGNAQAAASPPASAPVGGSGPPPQAAERRQTRGWERLVGALAAVLVAALLLQSGAYAARLWQSRQSNAVVLVADIGHGGTSVLTVLFRDHRLVVFEIDDENPQHTSVFTSTIAIAVPDDQAVLVASLQTILVRGRLDLVVHLYGGWLYHPEVTALLINNVAQLKAAPQAPGFRDPTPDELRRALQKLGA
jgi:hypothetical protein